MHPNLHHYEKYSDIFSFVINIGEFGSRLDVRLEYMYLCLSALKDLSLRHPSVYLKNAWIDCYRHHACLSTGYGRENTKSDSQVGLRKCTRLLSSLDCTELMLLFGNRYVRCDVVNLSGSGIGVLTPKYVVYIRTLSRSEVDSALSCIENLLFRRIRRGKIPRPNDCRFELDKLCLDM